MLEHQSNYESSFLVRGDQPLIGVLTEEDGKEVVSYFLEEESAESAISNDIKFTYYSNFYLSTHTYSLYNITTYIYNTNHHLTSITYTNSHTFIQNTYYTYDRVIQQKDTKLNFTTFGYNSASQHTVITDTRRYTTTYIYDTQYRVIS